MRIRIASRPLIFAVGILALGAILGNVLLEVEFGPPCERARAWVSANHSNLPSDLNDLTAYPITYQRTIFGSLSAEDRSRLWREHLRNAADDPRFSEHQREVILQVRERISGRLYTTADSVRAEITTFVESIKSEFTDEQFRSVFVFLGPTEGSLSHPSAAAVTLKEGFIEAMQSLQSSISASAQPGPCLCAIKADCESPMICNTWWQQCLPTWGCGYLWSEWCYALCEYW